MSGRRDDTGVRLRRAESVDAEVLVGIFHRSRAQAMPWLPVLHSPEEDLAWMAGLLEGEVLAAELAGSTAGFAAWAPGWLNQLWVEPHLQGRGVGSALLGAVREANEDGFQLYAFADNAAARRFYERRGLEAVAFGDSNEEHLPDVRYRAGPGTGASASR